MAHTSMRTLQEDSRQFIYLVNHDSIQLILVVLAINKKIGVLTAIATLRTGISTRSCPSP